MKRFELQIEDKDLEVMRKRLEAADIDRWDTMTDEELVTEAFYIDFGFYGELDLRDKVQVKKIE
jgi:hypothetical protein